MFVILHLSSSTCDRWAMHHGGLDYYCYYTSYPWALTSVQTPNLVVYMIVNHLSGKKCSSKINFKAINKTKIKIHVGFNAPMFTLSSARDSLDHWSETMSDDQLSPEVAYIYLKVCWVVLITGHWLCDLFPCLYALLLLIAVLLHR